MIYGGPLSDPTRTAAIANASAWVSGVLLGPMLLAVATVSIAAVGVMMLTGRVPLQRGMIVILGCFVLFGAPVIARGLLGPAVGGGGSLRQSSTVMSDDAPAVVAPPPQPTVYDPYAGAAVPTG